MSPVIFALLTVAGGFGAVLRYLVDTVVRRRVGPGIGLIVVNATGSLALGVATGMLAGASPELAVIGMGLLGGYTTFSAAVMEALQEVAGKRPIAGVVRAVGTLVLCVALAAVGLLVGHGIITGS